MSSENNEHASGGKIMLVGIDNNRVLERRLLAAGCHVIKVKDEEAALEHARHETFDKVVMVSRGSLIDVAETIFNLRDINRSLAIIVLVDRLGKPMNRFLRQLLDHPIEGTQIMTRRQLQRQLHESNAAPPGRPV
jgi:hypothetical protein